MAARTFNSVSFGIEQLVLSFVYVYSFIFVPFLLSADLPPRLPIPRLPIQLAIGTKTDKRRMLCAHERIVFQKRANIPKAGHIMFCMKTNYVCWTWEGVSLVCYGQVG